MAGQAAREAEAQDVECRLVVLRFCEALANFLLQVVAAVIGGVDDMLGPAAERFHHLALARDAVGGGAVLGERVAAARFGKAPLARGAGAVWEQRLALVPDRRPQLLDPLHSPRWLEAAAAAVGDASGRATGRDNGGE